MKKDKKILKSVTLISAALLTGSLATFAATNSNDIRFEYSSMGSGAEVRSEILDMNAPNILSNESTYKFGELKCGEGKCGEGKCGEGDKKEAKTAKEGEKAGTTKAVEGKTAEAKCGEGKCGEGEKKEGVAKKGTAKEGKAAEAKCGEGKCG